VLAAGLVAMDRLQLFSPSDGSDADAHHKTEHLCLVKQEVMVMVVRLQQGTVPAGNPPQLLQILLY
jgi:hypothetical protein